MTPETAFANLVQLLYDATFIPFAVGLVVVLSQLIKRLRPDLEAKGYGALVALTVQVLVWVGYSVAKLYGYEMQAQSVIEAAEKVLTVVMTVLFPALLSSGVSTVVYKGLRDNGVPGFRKAEE